MEAENKLKGIENLQVSGPEQDSVKTVIVSFYSSQFNGDYETLATLFPPVIDKYMGLKNIGKANLIENIKNWVTRNNVSNQRNNIDWNSYKVTRTSDGMLHASFNVDSYFTDGNPPTDHSYNSDVTIILNAEMKIISLTQIELSHASNPAN